MDEWCVLLWLSPGRDGASSGDDYERPPDEPKAQSSPADASHAQNSPEHGAASPGAANDSEGRDPLEHEGDTPAQEAARAHEGRDRLEHEGDAPAQMAADIREGRDPLEHEGDAPAQMAADIREGRDPLEPQQGQEPPTKAEQPADHKANGHAQTEQLADSRTAAQTEASQTTDHQIGVAPETPAAGSSDVRADELRPEGDAGFGRNREDEAQRQIEHNRQTVSHDVAQTEAEIDRIRDEGSLLSQANQRLQERDQAEAALKQHETLSARAERLWNVDARTAYAEAQHRFADADQNLVMSREEYDERLSQYENNAQKLPDLESHADSLRQMLPTLDGMAGRETSDEQSGLPPLDTAEVKSDNQPLREQDNRFKEQVQAGADALRDVEALKPEVWSTLNDPERVATLQEAENRLAATQGRPPLPIVASNEPGLYGYFDGAVIHVNPQMNTDVHEAVDTLAHEGRHAYQYYAVTNQGFHPDTAQVQQWHENFQEYKDAETYGDAIYRNQPIERDAWAYGQEVRAALYAGVEGFHSTRRDPSPEQPVQTESISSDRPVPTDQRILGSADSAREKEPVAPPSFLAKTVESTSGTIWPPADAGDAREAKEWTEEENREWIHQVEELAHVNGVNAHSLGKHGAQTTPEEQIYRAREGVAPDGSRDTRNGDRDLKDASRFLSHENHRAALEKAWETFQTENAGVAKQSVEVVFDDRNIGQGWTKAERDSTDNVATEPEYRGETNRVTVVFKRGIDGQYYPLTAFPSYPAKPK